jgi:hypothetical protein
MQQLATPEQMTNIANRSLENGNFKIIFNYQRRKGEMLIVILDSLEI